MSDKVYVTNIQRYCTDDGPGIRTTVFLKGCPLRCKWCHNPETHLPHPQLMQRNNKCFSCGKCIDICPSNCRKLNTEGITVNRSDCILCGKCADICPASACEICGKEMTADEVLETVLKDKVYYDTSKGGMTVSGGECALFPEFSLSLIKLAKENGINSAIETSGYGDKSFFDSANKLGVTFLYDLKEMNKEKHKQLCGKDNELILSNLLFLFENNADVIIRMPLIPGVNDDDDDLTLLYNFLSEHKDKFRYAQIMPYHSMGIGKSEALSKESFHIDEELSNNKCASSHERWKSYLKEFFNLG